MVNFLVAVLAPLVMHGEAKFDDKGFGDVEFEAQHAMIGTCLTTWFVWMFSIVGGFTAVIDSIFTVGYSDGAEEVPPFSSTLQCVINLTVPFFLVYRLLWIFIVRPQFNKNLPGMSDPFNAMRAYHRLSEARSLADSRDRDFLSGCSTACSGAPTRCSLRRSPSASPRRSLVLIRRSTGSGGQRKSHERERCVNTIR